jgi:uncharacterized phage protein gp47/JayE
MSFTQPDLLTIIQRIAGDIEGQLPGTDARLRRNVLAILARAQAGAAHGLYAHQDWIAQQVFPDTAKEHYLERWAAIWGIQRKSAVAATGSATFTGTTGTVLPAATVVARSDGVQFSTDAAATLVAGTASVALTALVAGVGANTSATVALTLVSPVASIDSVATVAALGLAAGAGTETDAELRGRVLGRIRQTPGGGTAADYRRWALEIGGVTRVWVFPAELGPGTVTVRFVDDDATPIIPPAATVAAVQAHLDTLAPVTATVSVYAPVATPLDLTIQLVPNTTAVQAAITAELTDLIYREGAPGATLLISHINEAIAIASGETDHSLIVPTGDVVYSDAQMPILGTITWQ